MSTMRVLFVAPRFPFPTTQGDRLRAAELLRRLRRRHAVTLIAPGDPQADAGRAAELCDRWLPVADSRWRAALRALAALPSAVPLQVAALCPPGLVAAARRLRAERFDVVHIHTARAMPAAEPSGAPAVVDLIDALSLNMRRRAARERPPASWLFAAEARRMRRYEGRLLERAAGAAVVSPADRAALGDHPRLRVIPMGVDAVQFPYAEGGRDAATLVFSGRMAYFPNADAARLLADEVLPLVRRRVPSAALRIVGADPPAAVRALGSRPGVTVTGFVPSVADELRRATVAVAPLRSGSGQQIKVVEAMASGAPVVATPTALAGVAARAGEHALVAEGAAGLADQIVLLLGDGALRLRLARAARELVESAYRWDSAAAAFERLYEEAAGVRR